MPVRTGMAAKHLLAQACERTGLDDFGSDSFREGLEILVRSVEEAPIAKPEARDVHYSWCLKALVNRLRVTDYAKTHAEVLTEKVERPLIVMGMPRSGTTLASNLLDQDLYLRAHCSGLRIGKCRTSIGYQPRSGTRPGTSAS